MQNEKTEEYYAGSVLLADCIKEFVDKGRLIRKDTFDEQRLQRAKYNVRLGPKYLQGGKFHDLDEKNNPFLIVEPYELVFVESYEVFELPENVVAVYDLRISHCLGGLGLQAGLQLDPTYQGKIFCPLFNFSDETVTLRYKDHLASVHFIYTTPSTPAAEAYPPFDVERQGLFSLSYALKSRRGSGLEKLYKDIKGTKEDIEGTKEELKSKLKEFDDKAARVHTRIDSMVGAVFGAMAFMIAALGVLVAAVTMIVTRDIVPADQANKVTILIGVIAFILIAIFIFRRIASTIRKTKNEK